MCAWRGWDKLALKCTSALVTAFLLLSVSVLPAVHKYSNLITLVLHVHVIQPPSLPMQEIPDEQVSMAERYESWKKKELDKDNVPGGRGGGRSRVGRSGRGWN